MAKIYMYRRGNLLLFKCELVYIIPESAILDKIQVSENFNLPPGEEGLHFVMVGMLRGLALLRPLGGTIIFSWRFIIFWSGLRGALSLALVLALPLEVPTRDALVFSTYAVVLFTLLVQRLSLRSILRRLPAVAATE